MNKTFWIYILVLDTSNENQNNIRLKAVASKVLHTVSLNFFNVIFNRICSRWIYSKKSLIFFYLSRLKKINEKELYLIFINYYFFRLEELSVSAEENPDYGDIELIQHISIDINRLIKLLNGTTWLLPFTCFT